MGKTNTISEEYIIPPDLLGKDVWVDPPDYHRPDGAKFVMDENLSLKDRKYLVSVGQPLILRGGAIATAKAAKEEKKATTDAESAEE